ncbi:MAG: SDR family oxidoreductase [Anaerolineae bacterium]|nr:SDR family oxidoreductase [Anaerolineae bacterium]
MSYTLSGIALVTGASRGIGRAIATRLASAGMEVAVAARSQDELEEVAQAIAAYPVALDVTDREGVARTVEIIERKLGAIDLLVNNAGIIEPGGPAWEREATEWWRVFEVNVLGPFLLMQAVIPRMIKRQRGRVINISSQAAHNKIESSPTYSAYVGSKAALTRVTEVFAHDARPYGVFVFAMRPGSIRTALVDNMLNDLGEAANDIPESVWTPVETAGEIVALMATGALDSLSGRHIDAGDGEWQSLPERIDEIVADDLFALRLRR